MANDVTLYENAAPMPAHIKAFIEDSEGNIPERQTVPSLSYEGKVWSISLNGEKTKLVKVDSDGDEIPVAVFRAVVLDFNKARGRAYYEGAYDPTKKAQPTCWSADSITPDASIATPQAKKCAECKWSAKNSRVNDQGKGVVACAQHRMLVVVPAGQLTFTPLRLKLAITSLYDARSPELEKQGWYAFDNYCEYLRSKGVKDTKALVTKMRFDPSEAYPKVIFHADDWLSSEDLATVVPIAKSEAVQGLLAGKWTPAGVEGVETAAAPAEYQESVKPAAKPVEKPATKPAAKATEKPVAKPNGAAAATVAAAVAEPPAKQAEVADDLNELLGAWGED